MKSSKLWIKPVLLAGVGVVALGMSSCIVGAPSGAYVQSRVYSKAVGYGYPSGLVRTSHTNWMYDPYRRAYYDLSRRSYYNVATRRYCAPPQRYSSVRYPSSWSGRGVLPHPKSVVVRNTSDRYSSDRNKGDRYGGDRHSGSDRYRDERGDDRYQSQSMSDRYRSQRSRTSDVSSSREVYDKRRYGSNNMQQRPDYRSSGGNESSRRMRTVTY